MIFKRLGSLKAKYLKPLLRNPIPKELNVIISKYGLEFAMKLDLWNHFYYNIKPVSFDILFAEEPIGFVYGRRYYLENLEGSIDIYERDNTIEFVRDWQTIRFKRIFKKDNQLSFKGTLEPCIAESGRVVVYYEKLLRLFDWLEIQTLSNVGIKIDKKMLAFQLDNGAVFEIDKSDSNASVWSIDEPLELRLNQHASWFVIPLFTQALGDEPILISFEFSKMDRKVRIRAETIYYSVEQVLSE